MLGSTLLIDTNILLSVLLKQNAYKITKEFLIKTENRGVKLLISDFAVHSICLVLDSRKETGAFKKFMDILRKFAGIQIYHLQPDDLDSIYHLNLKLDFDDKIHYYIAKNKNLTLVSYDRDFDKTDLHRFTPAQALKELV